MDNVHEDSLLKQPGEAELRARFPELLEEMEDYRARYEEALQRADEAADRERELRAEVDALRYAYDSISHAFWWRVTAPLRSLTDLLRRLFHRNAAPAPADQGSAAPEEAAPAVNVAKLLARQREESRSGTVRFSLLLPLRGSEEGLPALVDSLRAQTCPRWQLCAAGSADAVSRFREAVGEDSRILTA